MIVACWLFVFMFYNSVLSLKEAQVSVCPRPQIKDVLDNFLTCEVNLSEHGHGDDGGDDGDRFMYTRDDHDCYLYSTYYPVYLSRQCPAPRTLYISDVAAGAADDARKVRCAAHPHTSPLTPRVLVFNSTSTNTSALYASIKSDTSNLGYCALVMFYASYCPYSAAAAAHFNALARAFPSILVVAIDALTHQDIQYKYGSFAVPHISFFFNGKHFQKFNHTERSLKTFSVFITQLTGLVPKVTTFDLTEEDRAGPLSSEVEVKRDYALWASWIFIIYYLLSSDFLSRVKVKVLSLIT